jgi:hypothetical protein
VNDEFANYFEWKMIMNVSNSPGLKAGDKLINEELKIIVVTD